MANGLIRWGDFFGEFEDMRKKINEMFSMMPFQAERMAKEWARGEWYPAIDVAETKTEVLITAELPGMTENDVSIEVEEDSVVLRGERKEITDIEREGWVRKERSFGRFYRRITLPSKVDPDKGEATFKNGILFIRLPKIKPEGKGRRLFIKKEE
ncbi:MAG: Hsp20/alpha crystallin family protein [Candidatus Margulisiibacteriota bacterium]